MTTESAWNEKAWTTVATLPPEGLGGLAKLAANMPGEYADMLEDLVRLWRAKLARNMLRMRYYQGKNILKDLGISIPPPLLNVEMAVGWPQKAVDAMAVRSRFDGFTAADPDVQAALDSITGASALGRKYRMAAESALIHSCAFAAVGIAPDGSPAIDIYSAERAAARWDDATGGIAYGMCITAMEKGRPVAIDLHAPDAVVHLWDTREGWWDFEAEPIGMGRPTMEVLAYRPTNRRPFGQSRISRAVMTLTDSAVREALRTEISAEFFTSPQKYLLGADDEAFARKTKWEAYIGNIFAVGRDEDGNLPQFGQLSQGNMQPHTDYMRSLAARFSGETNIPISQLGVIHDQPASAEAIYAANEALVIDCEDFNDGARQALRNIAGMALATMLDVPLSELPPEYRDFTANFRNPAMPSIVSQTDAMMKIASVVPGFAGTDVFFEQLGFPEDMRRKVQQQLAENVGLEIVAAMAGVDDGGGQ